MSDIVYMTKERVKELEIEIRELKVHGRKEIAQKIAEARSHGDLSENAEYDAALHDQQILEMKINNLENTLSRVQVISPDELPDDKIYILTKVKLKNKLNGSTLDYMLVSPEEADFEKRKISVSSPIGKALMGKVVGDTAEIIAPAGKIKYEILEISK
ncbi:MAG: transcription elongation factor GreA [Ignavibacteriae bacterium]|nr:transcription elongation factor GreA [Ignavibacteriota bacterium]